MKKNWITKVAVLMLALVMVTSCFVGGTFAKYVTKAEGQDNARVAKWGVLVSIEGNAFASKYEATDDAYLDAGGELSVAASNEDQVVAPGTNSEQVGQTLIGGVTGTPEVAARYTLEGKAVKDVVLPAGTYTDYTQLKKADDGTYGYTGTFTLAKDYAPVKWNLVITGKNQELNVAEALYEALAAYPQYLAAAENYGLTPNGCSIFDAIQILKKVAPNPTYVQIVNNAIGSFVSGGRNFQLEAEDESFKLSYDFDPNKEMDYQFELSWEWFFDNETEVGEDEDGNKIYATWCNDQADTFLGNWAAVKLGQQIEGFVEPAAPASTEISATLVATATQID